MAKSKYVALGLSVVLAFSLVSCGKQTQEPPAQEPEQKTQQVEPVNIETPTPVEPKPEKPAEAKPLAEEADMPNEATPVDEAEPVETAEIQLFNDCNEVVYATGSVNIRASWNADSEKLGSLSAGESVTRTGTPVSGTEAEGWSRVELSDGSTAYISNKYLSTTKPVVQQPSQSTQTTKPAQSSTQATQNTQTTKPAQNNTQTQPSGGDLVLGPGYHTIEDSPDAQRDWSQYTPAADSKYSSWEEIEASWKGIGG